MRLQLREIGAFEESAPDVPLFERRDMRFARQRAVLHGQVQDTLQRDQVAVDGGVRLARPMPLRDEVPHQRRRNTRQREGAEDGTEMLSQTKPERPQRPPAIQLILGN
jgi:hypothetical protein